jgi:tRNA G26 N,N-dimethylase Trm1
LFSYVKDHYFRAFFRLVKSKEETDKVLAMHQFVLYCKQCGNFVVSRKNCGECSNCKFKFEEIGPMWVGELYDSKVAGKMFDSAKKDFPDDKELLSFLEIIAGESKMSSFGSFDVHKLSKRIKIGEIPKKQWIISEIEKQGNKFSLTHFNPLAIKTDMDFSSFIKILKSKKKK